jgi:hypothetical protein
MTVDWDISINMLEDLVASISIVVEEDSGTVNSALRIEAAGFFETLLTTHKSTRLCIIEDWNI